MTSRRRTPRRTARRADPAPAPSAGPPSAGPPSAGPPSAERGRLGEQLATDLLRAAGYRCVARNLRTRHGEIDALVRRRRLWVAVEVKTRTLDPAPEAAVDDAALARLRHALTKLAPHLRPRPRQLRVDVVAVRLRRDAPPEVRHFPGEPFDP